MSDNTLLDAKQMKKQAKLSKFEIYGPLSQDPSPKQSKIGLICDFSIYYRPEHKVSPSYINFTCLDEDIAEYIVENCRKGDFIHITRATPTVRRAPSGKVYTKFLVWDIKIDADKDL